MSQNKTNKVIVAAIAAILATGILAVSVPNTALAFGGGQNANGGQGGAGGAGGNGAPGGVAEQA